ncbi:hypothetical protein O6H91_Y259900 [Diphasiastrum complanatum]|nr:hypothetical protein O6H91_Y259900 [Diphasiastrum complanatum]KAJ7299285.1 hypothetical protein O6H91_Y259900 [Diphasiastrum complanatum]KAJ7299286.1 hypothetical protein O6H91_Y259900 [Diphasiastrum complanatum]KAJ7299287.1 hypothetical protein O6H91_Y259900 [Diphasiastrum complanatum]
MDCKSGKNGCITKRNQQQQNRRSTGKFIPEGAEIVVVAFDASKEIRKHPLEWALTNVVQPGDCITILALVPLSSSSWKTWSFSKLSGECATVPRFAVWHDTEHQIKQSCHQILREVQKLRDAKKVHVQVKVIQSETKGAAAHEAKSMRANWIVLDRHLKKDAKYCMQQLDCNIVLVNCDDAKILRLNLKKTSAGASRSLLENPSPSECSLILPNRFPKATHSVANHSLQQNSPEYMASFTSTDQDTSSSSSNSSASPNFFKSEQMRHSILRYLDNCSGEFISDSDYSETSPSHVPIKAPKQTVTTEFRMSVSCKKASLGYGIIAASPKLFQPVFRMDGSKTASLDDTFPLSNKNLKNHGNPSRRSNNLSVHFQKAQNKDVPTPTTFMNLSIKKSNLADLFRLSNSQEAADNVTLCSKEVAEKNSLDELVKETQAEREASPTEELDKQIKENLESVSNLRMAMSLPSHPWASPPPLCSICRCKAPAFGSPPQRFTYKELELATSGFSEANFLAQGGFGSVYRGVLPDGQAIAVKQHKLASSQGDDEFCSEVEAMSCAQHRNVVALIGYCMEDSRRLLVYEFICNGSLDSHLYGRDKPLLEWQFRQKIAVGAARGLRYLHEECRVGCIIHRDMRPNNILLTHDFEPMVGDFGLARWQPDGDLGVETRVLGTFGYLAPEYVQRGQINEKADVYSFGVVLLELATGRKAMDFSRPKGQQCLTEWARPLLENHLFHELADPRLNNCFNDEEMYCMLEAASLCIYKDPHLRPRMSQMLRILERDALFERRDFPITSRQHLMPNGD